MLPGGQDGVRSSPALRRQVARRTFSSSRRDLLRSAHGHSATSAKCQVCGSRMTEIAPTLRADSRGEPPRICRLSYREIGQCLIASAHWQRTIHDLLFWPDGTKRPPPASRTTYERFAELPAHVPVLRRPFGTRPPPTDGSIDQPRMARGALSLHKVGLRMAGILGNAGRATFCRARPRAMELKNAHIEVDPATTQRAIIEGKCPSCYRVVRRPLDSFKYLGYQCACGTSVTPPDDTNVLLASATKQARHRQSQN